MKAMIRWQTAFGALAILVLVGCTGIGPKTVSRDRFDYATAISKSWNNQMLLNMVKMRYADTPLFLDVSSVITQYAVEGEISLGASWTDAVGGGDSQNVGGTGRYRDQPTITYSPLIGKKFSESMMKPIPPPAIFFLIQSGYSVDLVFRSCVQSVNEIQNREGSHRRMREADPEFFRVVSLLSEIQQSGGVGMRIEIGIDKTQATIFTFRRKKISPEMVSKIKTVKRLLGLEPDKAEFKVVYGSAPRDNTEIAVLSRSMLEIMLELASYIDVPDEHVAEGRTYEGLSNQIDVSKEFGPLIEIVSSDSRPKDPFVSVRYRDYWFSVDDLDLRSKQMFSFMMLLFGFTETGAAPVPMVTIPTG